jgi:hypothetical protein
MWLSDFKVWLFWARLLTVYLYSYSNGESFDSKNNKVVFVNHGLQ